MSDQEQKPAPEQSNLSPEQKEDVAAFKEIEDTVPDQKYHVLLIPEGGEPIYNVFDAEANFLEHLEWCVHFCDRNPMWTRLFVFKGICITVSDKKSYHEVNMGEGKDLLKLSVAPPVNEL